MLTFGCEVFAIVFVKALKVLSFESAITGFSGERPVLKLLPLLEELLQRG